MFVNKCEESQSDYSAQKSFLECAVELEYKVSRDGY